MYISLNWLQDFVKIKPGTDPAKLGELLTLRTAEVEGVKRQDEYLDKVVTAKLLSYEKIEGSKKLHVAQFDLGDKKTQIVFGLVHKIEPGDILPIALPGAKLPAGEIKKAKLMGVESNGMVCADEEIGVKITNEGIIRFPEGTPLGKPIKDILKLNDASFDIDNKSLTHRPDLWGHIGIAREIAAITGEEHKVPEPKVQIPTSGEKVKVEIKDPDLCSRFSVLKIDNIKVEQSPLWLRNRLSATDHSIINNNRLSATDHSIINNVVDITNYVLEEYGQPMHAYDTNNIEEGFVIRRAKNKEKVRTLDDKDYELSTEDLVIADHKKIVSLGGVMGGKHSGISNETTSIILEAANFDAVSIRKTSQRLGLRSDSSQKFEKSLDPANTIPALLRAAELVLEVCPGAKIVSPITDANHWKEKKLIINLNLERLASKVGQEIPAKQVVKILESIDFKVTKQTNEDLTVEVPSFRATKDIENEDDIVEEVVRIYGYENIKPVLPNLPTRVPKPNYERSYKHELRHTLSIGLGYLEAYNYSFYNAGDVKKANLKEEDHFKLANVLTSEQTHMRVSMLPNLLDAVHEALKYEDYMKMYEVGRTYKEIGEYMPLEQKFIAGAITPIKGKYDRPFHICKGDVELLFEHFGIEDISFKPAKNPPPYAREGGAIEISSGKQLLGHVFEISNKVAKNYQVPKYTAMFEINLSELTICGKSVPVFKEIPKFPSMDLDITVLYKKSARKRILDLEELISKAAKQSNILKKVTLLYTYEGENIDEGEVAYTFRLKLLAEDRTLTDQDMSQVQSSVIKALEKDGGKIKK